MSSGWWMTASRRQMPRNWKIIRWNLLALKDPVVTSIEDVRRQVISSNTVARREWALVLKPFPRKRS